jgi:type VI secretion system protein ImpJ
MANTEVHWHEGMFLRQHHFLTERRHSNQMLQLNAKWDLHHNWGLRSIQLNLDAMANSRFVVTALKARLRDGTVIEVPEDGKLPEIDLKPAFAGQRFVTVYLAIPVVKSGRANVGNIGATDDPRYFLVNQNLEDENTGQNLQPITVRLLNLKLLLSTQDLAGYEVLPIARIEKSERAEATPELDKNYFPPVLACDAWHDLGVGILQSVYDRLGRKLEKLAAQVVSRKLSIESQGRGDAIIFGQLRELNEAYAVLTNLAFVEGIHPLPAYLELCRMVGQFAIFDTNTRRPPALPRYNHDDLAGCFYRVKRYLDDLFSIVPEPDYQERPFVGTGLRMQVEMERAWLEPTAQMFIGVQTTVTADECVRLMRPGALEMKIGSSERVETIYRMGDFGLQFTHSQSPPQSLPRTEGLTYFQVARDAEEIEWQYVERSLTLAIRLNEDLIIGSIDREQVLSLRYGNLETTIQFTLYVLLQGTGRPGSGGGQS